MADLAKQKDAREAGESSGSYADKYYYEYYDTYEYYEKMVPKSMLGNHALRRMNSKMEKKPTDAADGRKKPKVLSDLVKTEKKAAYTKVFCNLGTFIFKS